MPSRSVATIAVVILIFALAVPGGAGGATQEFTVYIDEAYATEVRAGEPIELSVTVRNDGEHEREVRLETWSASDHIKKANTSVTIKPESGKWLKIDVPTSEDGNGKYLMKVALKQGDTLLDRQELETSIGLVEDEDGGSGGDSEGDGGDEGDDGSFSGGGNDEAADALAGALAVIVRMGEPMGGITILIGVMFWGAGRSDTQSSRGKRLAFIGCLIMGITFSITTIANFFRYLAPYMLF